MFRVESKVFEKAKSFKASEDKLWRGIMDKNVLRSFCVVHYIVPSI